VRFPPATRMIDLPGVVRVISVQPGFPRVGRTAELRKRGEADGREQPSPHT
jgi:hypothetical protein